MEKARSTFYSKISAHGQERKKPFSKNANLLYNDKQQEIDSFRSNQLIEMITGRATSSMLGGISPNRRLMMSNQGDPDQIDEEDENNNSMESLARQDEDRPHMGQEEQKP